MGDIFEQTDWQIVEPPHPSTLPTRERRRHFGNTPQARRERQRLKPINPLGGLQKNICAIAYSKKEAEMLIADYGRQELMGVRMPHSGYDVSNVRSTDQSTNRPNYEKCGMKPPEVTLVGLNAKLTRAHKGLAGCEDDDDCIQHYKERIEIISDRLRNMSGFSGRRCYCGDFTARQTINDLEVAIDRMEMLK